MHEPVLLAAVALATLGPASVPAPSQDVVAALEQVLTDSIERARPSVVAINRIKSEDGRTRAIRSPDRRSMLGRGEMPILSNLDPLDDDFVSFDYASGVVVGEEGQILTTHHSVVGAERLIVRAPGIPPFDGEILAADPRSDLAVIAPASPIVGREGKSRLVPLRLGDASTLRVGSFLVALGNPFNLARDGQASASWGILANSARSLIPPNESGGQSSNLQLQHFGTLLQLDSKLNLGMSGGAVINLKGELVAITTASANAVGYDPRAGYAIPVDAIGRRAIDALVAGREVEYGFIGIKLESLGTHSTNTVKSVQPGTPAGEGGVVDGDQIIEVNGQPVRDFESLILAVNSSPVGQPVKVRLIRGGETFERTLVLSKFPVEGEVIATTRPPAWRGLRIDFSSVLALGIDMTLETMARGPVGVASVEPGSPAESAGLEPGMIIIGVEGKKARSPEEFRRLSEALGSIPVHLTVLPPTGVGDARTVTVPLDGAN